MAKVFLLNHPAINKLEVGEAVASRFHHDNTLVLGRISKVHQLKKARPPRVPYTNMASAIDIDQAATAAVCVEDDIPQDHR